MDHSIVLYFCGPDGEFREFFTQRALVADIVTKIEQLMKADATSPSPNATTVTTTPAGSS